MPKKSARPRIGLLNAYCRAHGINNNNANGRAPYEQAGQLLIQAGYAKKQPFETWKTYCSDHIEQLREGAKRDPLTQAQKAQNNQIRITGPGPNEIHITKVRPIKGQTEFAPENTSPLQPEFTNTKAWRIARMQVLAKHGARCQCCGAIANATTTINVDHIIPRKLRPELALDLDNLQVLCNACNQGKGNSDYTDWRPQHRQTTTLQTITQALNNTKTALQGAIHNNYDEPIVTHLATAMDYLLQALEAASEPLQHAPAINGCNQKSDL